MSDRLPAPSSNFEQFLEQFEYDRRAPLGVQEQGSERREGATIVDLRFLGSEEELLSAYWVAPEENGREQAPSILFVHPAPGSRDTFLEEALQFAGQKTASLLLEAPWADPESFAASLMDPQTARRTFTRVVKDLRRAVDLIVSRPEAGEAVGYTGHSFGAYLGGVLSGVEKRVRAFALMAGAPSFVDLLLANMPDLPEEAQLAYEQALAPIDPVFYVAHAEPAALFFQFGRQDNFVPRERYELFAQAGSAPKLVRWYDTDHYFGDAAAALEDRLDWFKTQLKR